MTRRTTARPPAPPDGWRWPRLPRAVAGPVVVQTAEEGCGPACAEMLLRDRGFAVDQESIARTVPLPATAERLARRMTELSAIAWQGGALYVPGGATWELVRGLSRDLGSWAALLEPAGYRQVGHWVVVDGISDDGVVGVRDPVGEAYGIPLGDFTALWRYNVLVIEESAP